MVRWLNEVSKSNTEEVGEKAALLGEMIKFGFPVPRGFVISYDEFDKAMVELGPEIQSILSIANPDNFNSILTASSKIKEYLFVLILMYRSIKKPVIYQTINELKHLFQLFPNY